MGKYTKDNILKKIDNAIRYVKREETQDALSELRHVRVQVEDEL